MNTNLVQTNHFVAKGGRLFPRPTTPPNGKKNYRYIPFDPINRPGPDDYFRETISRLQQQNAHLRRQLNDKPMPSRINTCENTNSTISILEAIRMRQQIQGLQAELGRTRTQLSNKDSLLVHKDKQVLELTSQNTRLHLKVENFLKELDALHGILNHKDQELESKNMAIRNYCRTIEDLAKKDQEDQKTTYSSDYYLSTPRIDEKDEEYEDDDEFYSMNGNSCTGGLSYNGRMYMTPDNHSFKSFEEPSFQFQHQSEQVHRYDTEQSHRYDTEERNQNRSEEFFTNPSANSSFNEQARGMSRSNSAESMKSLSDNLNTWSQWAALSKSSMTFDLIQEDIDPMAGGFLSMLKRN